MLHNITAEEGSFSKNGAKIDFLPLLGVPGFLGSLMDKVYVESSGFALKFSYERFIIRKISVGADFSFVTASASDYDGRYKIDVFSTDTVLFCRYYPWENPFFVYSGLGLCSFNFKVSGNSSGLIADWKDDIEPLNGISGVFDLGLGGRFLLGRHLIIEPSIMYGFYLGDAPSATTLLKTAGGMIPVFSDKSSGFKYRFDVSLLLGWAF
jgi:hypothetical protein